MEYQAPDPLPRRGENELRQQHQIFASPPSLWQWRGAAHHAQKIHKRSISVVNLGRSRQVCRCDIWRRNGPERPPVTQEAQSRCWHSAGNAKWNQPLPEGDERLGGGDNQSDAIRQPRAACGNFASRFVGPVVLYLFIGLNKFLLFRCIEYSRL